MGSSGATRLSRLLQRTRVSTYDPTVPRVYTAPTAHAARGDWGLKRPMPSSWHAAPDAPAPQPFQGALRYATVQRLDTQQGLTEWRESERDPLFRARWHEAGARLSDRSKRDGLSSAVGEEETSAAQGLRPRILYDEATRTDDKPAHVVWGTNHAKFTTTPDLLPNYNAMSEREFQKFLYTVRRQRPKFRAALSAERRAAAEHAVLEQLARKKAKDNGPAVVSEEEYAEACKDVETPDVDLWDEARLPHAPQSAASFFKTSAQTRADAPKSHTLTTPAHAAAMHPLHGLQYSQPDSVYTHLLAEPIQGHAVSRVEDARRSRYFVGADAGLAVAAGGHVAHLPLQHRQGLDVVDYTRANASRGAGYFRVLHAYLDLHATPHATRRTPPNVAATEPALGYVRSQLMALRRPTNAPLPGTRTWIDDPAADARSSSAARSESGSLFGALARNGRAPPPPRGGGKRQRFQKRKRDTPSTHKDVQMLDNIKNLLSPQ